MIEVDIMNSDSFGTCTPQFMLDMKLAKNVQEAIKLSFDIKNGKQKIDSKSLLSLYIIANGYIENDPNMPNFDNLEKIMSDKPIKITIPNNEKEDNPSTAETSAAHPSNNFVASYIQPFIDDMKITTPAVTRYQDIKPAVEIYKEKKQYINNPDNIVVENTPKFDFMELPKKVVPVNITNENTIVDKMAPLAPVPESNCMFLNDIIQYIVNNGFGYVYNKVYNTEILEFHIFKDNTHLSDHGFFVDPGLMYDGRVKFSPYDKIYMNNCSNNIYMLEGMRWYSLSKQDEKKTIFDSKYLDVYMKSGINGLYKERSLYNSDYQKLNAFVDTISITSAEGMNRDTRVKIIRVINQIMQNDDIMKYLSDISLKYMNPYMRFRMESFDKDSGTFVLTNTNVKQSVIAPALNMGRIDIIWDNNKVNVNLPVVKMEQDPNAPVISIQ